ncbi:MAG: STT3 domain-containing protein [Promethearchaeota archaeon]
MGKVGNAFNNFKDRIRAAVSVKTQNVLFFFALALVVALAVMVRMTPILRGPTLIKAFDPWIQYYNAKYITEHSLYEYFHWMDYKSWYPSGMDRSKLRPGLPFTAATIYIILNSIGIPISIYDVCYYFPAFMGGLTCLAAYFLGKEVLDRNCGLFCAFFLAFNTGHMQRTMAGFFDNETIGVFASLMTFIFFLKTIHTGKATYSIIGGMFLGYLSLSWGGYEYVYLLIPLICGILVLINKYNENVLTAYAGVEGTAFLIASILYRFNYDKFFSSIELGGVFLFTIILLIFHLIYLKRTEYPKFYKNLISGIKGILIPGALIVAMVIWINPNIIPFGFGGRLRSILSPLMRDQLHIVASVAEHMPSAWSVFYYNTLIPLMLLPLGVFFCFKRGEAADVFQIVFLLTLFYFTGSMIRIILLFAPAAALVGAYGLVSVLKIFGSYVGERKAEGFSRKRKRQVKRTIGNGEIFAVYLIVGVLCTAQVFHGADISINQLSYSQIVAGGQFHDWEESLTWMKTNLNPSDVVVSWWDYGYWLTPIGNITTVNDNGTWNVTRIGLTGMAMMQTNEIYSAKIFRLLKADYVLVYFGFLINGLGGDEGKWPWMLRICNDHYNAYKQMGLQEDNWAENTVFDEADYINETSQKYEDSWFESTLVKLMFGYEPTDPNSITDPTNNQLRWNYASHIAGNPSAGIAQNKDDNGNPWKSHIPDNGEYDFKVFKPAYFSRNGMVKLWKVDYTALDSSFIIKNAKVHDNGIATFTIKNTGKKDLEIKSIAVNDLVFNANNISMGIPSSTKTLLKDSEDVIWLNYTSLGASSYSIGDTVNITVTAEANALENTKYTFTNYTKNFFVTEAEQGSIKINRENSRVVQLSETSVDVYLEVENTGNTIENIDRFYLNVDNDIWRFNTTEYLSGSSVLSPGDKAEVYVPNKAAAFYPLGQINNTIGVVTASGVRDETIFASNYEGYKLSIINEERVVSPEFKAVYNYGFRSNIPLDLNDSFVYVYDNASNYIQIKVKNTGDIVVGLDSVYLFGDRTPVDFDTIDHDLILNPGEENIIIADASGFDIDVNENVLFTITAIDYELKTAASDFGYVHAITPRPSIKGLIGNQYYAASYVMANESAILTIKNTGNESLSLDKIYINDTIEIPISNVDFLYGDKDLSMQEISILKFNIPNIAINVSNNVKVNVTTNKAAFWNKTFKAVLHPTQGPKWYDILISPSNSTADEDGTLSFEVKYPTDSGILNITIDSVYVNDTYIGLDQFTVLGSPKYILEVGDVRYFSISMAIIEARTGLQFYADEKLKLVVRTIEGAEDEYEIKITL